MKDLEQKARDLDQIRRKYAQGVQDIPQEAFEVAADKWLESTYEGCMMLHDMYMQSAWNLLLKAHRCKNKALAMTIEDAAMTATGCVCRAIS